MPQDRKKIFNFLDNHIDSSLSKMPEIISSGKVLNNWIDYNNHMNMAYYVQCFEESTDFILEFLNLGFEYSKVQNKGIFVIQCNIEYKNEINLDEKFIIINESFEILGKKIVIKLKMCSPLKDKIYAIYEIINLNVNLKTKKSEKITNEEILKIKNLF